MTTVKVKLRTPRKSAGQECALVYQITHSRQIRQIETAFRVSRAEWDAGAECIAAPAGATPQRAAILKEISLCIEADLRRFDRIIGRLAMRHRPFAAADVAAEFKRNNRDNTLFRHIEMAIRRLSADGRLTTALHYRSALNSFRSFRQGADLMLDALTPEIMENYQAWQRSRGLVPNTISFYNRILRAIYRRAVEADIIDDCQPFRRVYTGIDKTIKRAMPLSTLRALKSLDLSHLPTLDFARDIFLLSFYLRGMSFIDMCFLRVSNLRNGSIIYRRRKTGQQLSIAWTPEMQQILDKYPSGATPYLLPIITRTGIDEYCAYRNVGYRINSNLKRVGQLLGAPDAGSWSLYCARHSWASLARAQGVPVSIISEAMGHDSESTTRIYLASLEASAIDQANSLVISAL